MGDNINKNCFFHGQTSPMDVPYSLESPSPIPLNQYAPTFFDNSMEPPITTILNRQVQLPKGLNAHFDMGKQPPISPRSLDPLYFTNSDELTFMPTPSLSVPFCSNESVTLGGQPKIGSTGSFTVTNQIPTYRNTSNTAPSFFPSPSPSPSLPFWTEEQLYHLLGEAPNFYQPELFPSTRSLGYHTFMDPYPNQYSMGCPIDLTLDQLSSYLDKEVELDQEPTQSYMCNICLIEYPNAQAFGGHMSSHSKTKKKEQKTMAMANQTKKAKHTKSLTSLLLEKGKGKARRVSKKSKRFKGGSTDNKTIAEEEIPKEEGDQGLNMENPPAAEEMQADDSGYMSDGSASSDFHLGEKASFKI